MGSSESETKVEDPNLLLLFPQSRELCLTRLGDARKSDNLIHVLSKVSNFFVFLCCGDFPGHILSVISAVSKDN